MGVVGTPVRYLLERVAARVLGPVEEHTGARMTSPAKVFFHAIEALLEGDGTQDVPLTPSSRWLLRLRGPRGSVWELPVEGAASRFQCRDQDPDMLLAPPRFCWKALRARDVAELGLEPEDPQATQSIQAAICGHASSQYVELTADPVVAIHQAVALYRFRERCQPASRC